MIHTHAIAAELSEFFEENGIPSRTMYIGVEQWWVICGNWHIEPLIEQALWWCRFSRTSNRAMPDWQCTVGFEEPMSALLEIVQDTVVEI